MSKRGKLAQLVELLPYKQAVTGSSPVPSILKVIAKADKLNHSRSAFWLTKFSGLNPHALGHPTRHPDVDCSWDGDL